MLLKNKTTLITGASSGIGKEIAQLFAAEGSNLILTARRIERIKELANQLTKKHNIKTLPIEIDVRNYDLVKNKLTNLPKDLNKIDILINNAGKALGIEKINDGIIENWNEMIDTNIKGLLYVSRAIIPLLIEQKKGLIINIGSIAGHEVYPGGNVYCATKYAVNALTKSMNIDLNGTGVKACSIDPGMVETEFSLVRFKGNTDKANAVYKNVTPLTPQDIAEITLFIATRPQNVNIQSLIVTPTCQASTMIIDRKQPI